MNAPSRSHAAWRSASSRCSPRTPRSGSGSPSSQHSCVSAARSCRASAWSSPYSQGTASPSSALPWSSAVVRRRWSAGVRTGTPCHARWRCGPPRARWAAPAPLRRVRCPAARAVSAALDSTAGWNVGCVAMRGRLQSAARLRSPTRYSSGLAAAAPEAELLRLGLAHGARVQPDSGATDDPGEGAPRSPIRALPSSCPRCANALRSD